MNQSPPFIIRDYQPADHQEVSSLNRYGLEAAGVPTDSDIYAGDLDDVAGVYLTQNGAVLVGEVSNRLVGMDAILRIDDDNCEIARMRISQPCQGRGFGRAMLIALEARAHCLGYRRVVLVTGPHQHPAVDLYRSEGYDDVGLESFGDLIGLRMGKNLISLGGRRE